MKRWSIYSQKGIVHTYLLADCEFLRDINKKWLYALRLSAAFVNLSKNKVIKDFTEETLN